MKLKKRMLKFATIFGVCWFALLVLLVDGILKFQTLVDRFGSYALVEITLILLVILPTVAVYFFTKEKQTFDSGFGDEGLLYQSNCLCSGFHYCLRVAGSYFQGYAIFPGVCSTSRYIWCPVWIVRLSG